MSGWLYIAVPTGTGPPERITLADLPALRVLNITQSNLPLEEIRYIGGQVPWVRTAFSASRQRTTI
jgi:hypothetical protein